MKPQPVRNHHWSLITKFIRGTETLEVHRWYAGPRWCNVTRVYHLTPSDQSRLKKLDLIKLMGVC